MASSPRLNITISLSSNVYKRSAPGPEKPKLIVSTTLSGAPNLVVETRGETDSGTVLVDRFRVEHFEFYDLKTSQPVVHDLFPGTCEPRSSLHDDGAVELSSARPLLTGHRLEDISPLSDPVRLLEAGHEYRIRLKPQTVPGYVTTKDALFKGRRWVDLDELPETLEIKLESDDELVLKVVA